MTKKKRTADLKRLIKDYKKAKADHHAKEKARRQASARTLALRVQIASLFQESGMNVYRAVYLAQKDERTGRTNLQRLAFGKNLDVTPIVANAAQSDTGSADVSSDCPECEE